MSSIFVIFALISLLPSVIILGFLGFFQPFILRGLKKKGVPGEAEILSIGFPSGRAVYSILKVTLRVSVAGHSPYVTKTMSAVPAKKFRPSGSMVPVWVDPKKPQRVYIDWGQVLSVDERLEQQYGNEKPPSKL
jgi:hypothetical protein